MAKVDYKYSQEKESLTKEKKQLKLFKLKE